ncbi:MAG: hypothetical protein LBG45_06830 [Dysgonamonadaceae bacterium]|nr:hypothetical protein [Dysgonamonadaceae bacterium]
MYKNTLSDNQNDYIAKVESQRSPDISQICESAATRGRTDITAKSMEHAVELFLEELEFPICSGFSANFKIFIVSIHIN